MNTAQALPATYFRPAFFVVIAPSGSDPARGIHKSPWIPNGAKRPALPFAVGIKNRQEGQIWLDQFTTVFIASLHGITDARQIYTTCANRGLIVNIASSYPIDQLWYVITYGQRTGIYTEEEHARYNLAHSVHRFRSWGVFNDLGSAVEFMMTRGASSALDPQPWDPRLTNNDVHEPVPLSVPPPPPPIPASTAPPPPAPPPITTAASAAPVGGTSIATASISFVLPAHAMGPAPATRFSSSTPSRSPQHQPETPHSKGKAPQRSEPISPSPIRRGVFSPSRLHSPSPTPPRGRSRPTPLQSPHPVSVGGGSQGAGPSSQAAHPLDLLSRVLHRESRQHASLLEELLERSTNFSHFAQNVDSAGLGGTLDAEGMGIAFDLFRLLRGVSADDFEVVDEDV